MYYRPTGRVLTADDVDVLLADGPDRWHLLGLMSMVRNGYVREAATERLALGPAELTLRYLLLRSDDWVEPVQRRAISAVLDALAEERSEPVLEALPAIWDRLIPGAERGRAADLADAVEAWLTDPAQRQALLTGARSDDRWVRRLAVRTLVEVEDPHMVLTHARLDDDVVVAARVSSAYLTSPSPDPHVVAGLLDSPFASVRESAAFWLLHKQPEAPDDDLVSRVMSDRSRSVRFQAQSLLRSQGIDPADWYRSRDPLRDPSVARGLADVGSDFDEQLALTAMASPVPAVRAAGVRLLAASTTQAATDALVHAVLDPAPGLGAPAAFALRKRGLSPEQARQLTDHAGGGDEAVARNVRRALLGLPRWPRLVAALRLATLDGSGGTEGEELLEVVVRQWERAATQPTTAELAEASALLKASTKRTGPVWRAVAVIVDGSKLGA